MTRERRPGLVVAAAVLAYVLAGLLVIAAILLFTGASLVDRYDNTYGGDDATPRFVLFGLANFVMAALFLWGGILLLGRRSVGRRLLVIGAAIDLLAGILWLVWIGSAATFWMLMFLILAGLPIAFVLGGAVTYWLGNGSAAARYDQRPPG